MLADCTGVCRGVAWEDVIKVLEVDCTYKLRSVTVRSFNQAKYVSLGERAAAPVSLPLSCAPVAPVVSVASLPAAPVSLLLVAPVVSVASLPAAPVSLLLVAPVVPEASLPAAPVSLPLFSVPVVLDLSEA